MKFFKLPKMTPLQIELLTFVKDSWPKLALSAVLSAIVAAMTSAVRSCEKMVVASLAVIPAEAGIQKGQRLTKTLDPGFHRGDGQNSIFSQLLRHYTKDVAPHVGLIT